MNIVSYAVTTVENSFTWYELERYKIMIENENELFMIVLIFRNQSLKFNHIPECNKCRNVLCVRTQPHPLTPT